MLRTNGLRAYRLCRYFMQTPTSKAFLRFRVDKYGGRSRVTRHQRTSGGNASARLERARTPNQLIQSSKKDTVFNPRNKNVA